MYRTVKIFTLLAFICINMAAAKQRSVFYPQNVLQVIQRNANSDPWAMEARQQAIKTAEPWLHMSDDAIWELMLPSTITRSWMVWSNGYCPACKVSVTMYNWKIAPFEKPWKVQCPHCKEFFPKNDFSRFYRSGLDEHGIFDPHLADRSLLYNVDHPDPQDPLHLFGVDDGEGYSDGTNRWRFIGAYLIYGQWKQLVISGVRALAAAYVLTGDMSYAHKAAILLDRIADVYGQFDFSQQAMSYERRDPIIGLGYVSVWHDACEETRELVLAYDMIYEAMANDPDLVPFLRQKAQNYKLANAKSAVAQITQNIEQGLMQDVLHHRSKVESNFPRTEALIAIIETVRDWPNNRTYVQALIDAFISKGTAVDGLSGEKGLSGYSAGLSRSLAQFLSLYNRLEPGFLAALIKRHPDLKKTFRFHIDTWFNASYYPKVGDTGIFGQKSEQYIGAQFAKNAVAADMSAYAFASTQSLFWNLYKITRDPAYVQIIYKENGSTSTGLPYDILVDDPRTFQARVDKVIAENGTELKSASFNFEKWCLAMLYSGSGPARRALWIDYDLGGNHSHADALNIGLFAMGLDLLPGFGYPAVQFGGWYSPKALWYRRTAAHNTVVVNGLDQIKGIGERETAPIAEQLNPLKAHVSGKTLSWMPGRQVQGIRVGDSNLYRAVNLQQYDRTVFLIDRNDQDFYVLDIFRIRGGADHTKFSHGYFGDLSYQGLALQPQSDFGFNTEMKEFKGDAHPAAGWQVIWNIKDHYDYLAPGRHVHLAYLDASKNIEADVAKTWIAFGFQNDQIEWIPSLLLRHKGQDSLVTCFAGVWEAYEQEGKISRLRRSLLQVDGRQDESALDVALAVEMKDGCRDYIVAMNEMNKDKQNHRQVSVADWSLQTDGDFCLLRTDSERHVNKMALAGGTFIRYNGFELSLKRAADFIEVDVNDSGFSVQTANGQLIRTCRPIGK
jgi:oligo-alginate lyase